MRTSFPAAIGPAAGGHWQALEGAAGVEDPGRPLYAQVIPDGANAALEHAGAQPVFHALPARPRVARAPDGRPVFSLTLVLSRSPAVEEESVYALIQQGVITMDLTLMLSDQGVAGLGASAPMVQQHPPRGADVRALFARDVTFALETPTTPLVVVASGGGAAARASVQATLTREQTLDVLGALDGTASALNATATVTYRATGSVRRRLTGEWATVHDYIQARVHSADQITRTELHDLFTQMIRDRVLTATVGSRSDNGDGELRVFDAFVRQSAVVLRRLTSDIPSTDPANLYALRARPVADFHLEHEEVYTGQALDTVTVGGPLDAVLGGLLDGEDRDGYIRLVSLTTIANDSTSSGIGAPPRPRRLAPQGGPRWPGEPSPERSDRAGAQDPATQPMAAVDGDVRSVALKLRPEMASAHTTDRNAQAMIASGVARPLAAGLVATHAGNKLHWYLDDWRLEKDKQHKPRALPVVTNPADPIWPDRVTAGRFWYAPVFALQTPEPSALPEASPFLFAFRRIGDTLSGPALDGTIRFTLKRGMSEATRQALAARGNPQAGPVPVGNLAVSLVLPFINSNDNHLTRHTCPCALTDDGQTVTASVSLTTDWLRIAYTLLSSASPQPEPARLSVAFSFETYAVVRDLNLHLAFGTKQAAIPVVYSAAQLREVTSGTYLDAKSATLNFDGGAVMLKREAAVTGGVMVGGAVTSRAGLAAMSAGGAMSTVALRPSTVAMTSAANLRPTVPVTAAIAHPVMRPGLDVADLVKQSTYALRTLLRQEQQDAIFPCNTLGAFYRETVNGEDVAVGCRRAMELGQVSYRQYERVPALDSAPGGIASYSVYRSLQQPGRFLVLPARYGIARHAPGSPDAYKPRVLLYSDEDPARALRTPIVFSADLQPDLPAHARRDLATQLAQLASDPVIDYPTAIECATAFTFHALDSADLTVTRTPDSFSFTIASSAADWPLLFTRLQTGGVLGQVRFILADGTELTSTLTVDLRHVVGPWEGGAVVAEHAGDGVRLSNRIERPVDVHEVMAFSNGTRRRMAVERAIPAGSAQTVALDPPSEAGDELFPVYTMPATPVALATVPNAIERVHINVLFTNQILFSNHALTAITVFARRAGAAGAEQLFVLPDTTVAEADFLMPLTEYVASPVVQLRFVKSFADGHAEVKEWFDWNLNAMGFVVSLTWSLVQ